MTRVSILSTGLMGTALARAFLAKGYEVTVWNRTAANASPLQAEGAHLAPTVQQAVAASDLVIAIPKHYEAVKEMLFHETVSRGLSGKTLVVLCSAHSPAEPKELAEWARQNHCEYLDGKIFDFPNAIGKPSTPLVYCRDEAVLARVRSALEVLGTTSYLGADITFAALLEVTSISWFFSTVCAFLNGIALCKASNFPTEFYLQGCLSLQPVIGSYFEKVVRQMLPQNDFDAKKYGTSVIDSWMEMASVRTAFESARIAPRQIDAFLPLLQDFMKEDGGGRKDLAAIIDRFNLKD